MLCPSGHKLSIITNSDSIKYMKLLKKKGVTKCDICGAHSIANMMGSLF